MPHVPTVILLKLGGPLQLVVVLVCVILKRSADLVLWFPDKTSVCSYPWHQNDKVFMVLLNLTKLNQVLSLVVNFEKKNLLIISRLLFLVFTNIIRSSLVLSESPVFCMLKFITEYTLHPSIHVCNLFISVLLYTSIEGPWQLKTSRANVCNKDV